MKRKVLAGLLTVVMAAGFVAVPGMQTEVKADDKKLVGVAMPTKDLQRWNQDGENMKKSFKDFLSEQMDKYNKFDSNDLERLKKHFEKVMSFIIIQLGTDAFAKYKVENEKLKLQSHFNAAVYDAISIAISDKIMEDETFTITTQMKQRLKQLFFNDDFIDSINGSTNDKSKILKRIKIVKGVLK